MPATKTAAPTARREFLTLREAATRLNISYASVLRLTQDKIPTFRTGGVTRIKEADLTAYVQQNTTGGTPRLWNKYPHVTDAEFAPAMNESGYIVEALGFEPVSVMRHRVAMEAMTDEQMDGYNAAYKALLPEQRDYLEQVLMDAMLAFSEHHRQSEK